MAKIELSMPYVLLNEGGYAEPPQIDQPTKYGIIAATLAEFLGRPVTKADIRNLSIETATAIYKKQYWERMGLDDVDDQNIATCLFDTGVNRGVHVGALYAQQTCNGLGARLVLDGVIGPLSKQEINYHQRALFIQYYERLEWAGYQAILSTHPEDEKYRLGWEGRAKRLLTLI